MFWLRSRCAGIVDLMQTIALALTEWVAGAGLPLYSPPR
jgi:hypothetical protein